MHSYKMHIDPLIFQVAYTTRHKCYHHRL